MRWRIEHETPSLSWSERCPTSFLQHCGRRIHIIRTKSTLASGVYIVQEKVYRSRIANVKELKAHLIDEWARLDQSIVGAAIGQWRCHLSSCARVSGAHFEHQF